MTPLPPGPFGDTPAVVPGVIEVDEFDYGGESVAYSDSTEANAGGVSDAVGFDDCPLLADPDVG